MRIQWRTGFVQMGTLILVYDAQQQARSEIPIHYKTSVGAVMANIGPLYEQDLPLENLRISNWWYIYTSVK